MKLLHSSEEISASLNAYPPSSIAVAYLGLNWNKYIHINAIESIIISPTIGTNPNAVASIVKEIGWDKVYFLPKLHSKIYFSKEQVILGSANLSSNGLGNNEQYESGISSTNEKIITQASKLYDAYLKKSKQLYPTADEKIIELNNLWLKYNKRKSEGWDNDPKIIRDFIEYDPYLHGQFYIMWYVDGDTEYTENVPEIVTNEIASEVHLSPHDNIDIGKWVLYWKINKNNTVNKTANITWVYIHEFYKDGCDDEGYEDLCIERERMKLPDFPFQLTSDFKNAFTTVIEGGRYDEFRDSQKEPWLNKNTENKFTSFIEEIKIESKKLTNKVRS